jgi:hypothetical protein
MISGIRASLRIACAAGILVGLAACAGDVVKPDVVVQSLSADQLARPHVTQVVSEAGKGVAMTPAELDKMSAMVLAQIKAGDGSAVVDPNTQTTPPSMKIKMVFTQYDGGSAFARAMLIGLGQIHIDADVLFIDSATGSTVGNYKVSKDFSLGGIGGAFTSIDDVQVGFAKSVAAIIVKRPS